MVVMNLEVDNLLAFKDFKINFSYPKKIVNSSIENEHLFEKPNFRYKKVNIIMGANASGKTSVGKILMGIFNFISKKRTESITKYHSDKKKQAKFSIDFIPDSSYDNLYRIEGIIFSKDKVDIKVYTSKIYTKDSYEKCIENLKEIQPSEAELNDKNLEKGNYIYRLNLDFKISWLFNFSENSFEDILEKNDKILDIKVLEAVLKTLDSSITKVEKLRKENDDSDTNIYSITLGKENILIQNGELLNKEILSSGTQRGVDIAYLISSIRKKVHSLCFCDEKFSYIQSDVEIAILSLMISLLKENTQLFFTTHNLDVLEMGLPHHSFMFLRKDYEENEECKEEENSENEKDYKIKVVYPETIIKKNDVSLKNAIKNDIFEIAPDIRRIFELEDFFYEE